MTLDQYKTEPPEDEPENKCGFCDERCDNDFCNKDCKVAYFND